MGSSSLELEEEAGVSSELEADDCSGKDVVEEESLGRGEEEGSWLWEESDVGRILVLDPSGGLAFRLV